jgi:hypothetical protein
MIHAELARMVVDARRRDLEREARADALIRDSRAARHPLGPPTTREFHVVRPLLRTR